MRPPFGNSLLSIPVLHLPQTCRKNGYLRAIGIQEKQDKPLNKKLQQHLEADNMKVLLLLTAVIMAFGPIQIQGGLAEFQKMVELKTGYFSGLVYLTYACHCGLGGSGYPVDETDWCCFYHDCCYDRLEIRDCGTLLGLPYHFTKQGNEIVCSSNQDPCQRQLCQCDKVAADCFARNLQTFKFPYIFYSNKRCRGKTPSCSFLHSLVV
uniref:phospholipase A2, membrane associated-like n=1 Tax=Myodes glareolus TaxID=447135 RepID=UPI002020304D|nr:phospholipase A2, membrane associated-like [Myodes glareolus]